MMKKTSYTFQEVLGIYPALCPTRPHDKDTDANFFSKMLTAADLKWNAPQGLASTLLSLLPDVVDAVMLSVYNRHSEDFLYSKFGSFSEDLSLVEADFSKAVNNILNVLDNTIDKYIPLLKLAKDNSADLLKPVSSTSSGAVKFNDTPQDSGDVFAGDSHVSTHTTNTQTTSVDVGTLMERLNSVFKDFPSVMLNWSNEFAICFRKELDL